MPYTFNYANAFTPGMGEALFDAAKDQTDFARIMKNNEIRLQNREMDQQEARIELEQSRINLARAREARIANQQRKRTRLKQNQQVLDQKQARRDLTLQEQAEERRQRALEHEIEQSTGVDKDRLREQYNEVQRRGGRIGGMRPGDDWYQQTLENGRKAWIPRTSPEEQRQMEQETRAQRNALRKGGAEPVPGKDKIPDGMVPFKDPEGQWWAVHPEQKSDVFETYKDDMVKYYNKELTDRTDKSENLTERRKNVQNEIKIYRNKLSSVKDQIDDSGKDRSEDVMDKLEKDKTRYETALTNRKDELDAIIKDQKENQKKIDSLRESWKFLITPEQRREKEETQRENEKKEGQLNVNLDNIIPADNSRVRGLSAKQIVEEIKRVNEGYSDKDAVDKAFEMGYLQIKPQR